MDLSTYNTQAHEQKQIEKQTHLDAAASMDLRLPLSLGYGLYGLELFDVRRPLTCTNPDLFDVEGAITGSWPMGGGGGMGCPHGVDPSQQ